MTHISTTTAAVGTQSTPPRQSPSRQSTLPRPASRGVDAGLRVWCRRARAHRDGRWQHDGAAPGGGRDLDPRLRPLSKKNLDLAGIDIDGEFAL